MNATLHAFFSANRLAPLDALERVAEYALEATWPERCLACGRSTFGRGRRLFQRTPPLESLLCRECQARIASPATAFCARCGMPKPRGARAARCGRCSDGDWFFAEALPLSAYRGLARAVVLRLKETGNPVFADALARLYFQSREAELRRFAPDCVVAVPMNWRRKYFIRHGINSPETLAKRLATELGVPLASRFVKRVRATSPQTTVEWSERALNVRDAFAIDAPRGARPFVSKRALLVDDALSSCATANEISRILLAAGAEAVCVAALTRGGLD